MTGVDPLVVVNVVAVAGLSVVGGLAAWRRSVPGAGALSAIAFLTAAQPSLQVVVLVASDVSPASVRLFAVVWRALPPLWLGFAAAYTGRGPALGPRWTALLAVVAVGWQLPGVLFELTGLVRLFLELGWVLLFVATAYSALLLWRATDDGGLSRRRAAGLLGACGTSVALFAAVLIPDGGAVASAGLSLATAGCLAVAVVNGALDRAPGTDHLARERLLAAMDEAAIVADRAGRLSDANAAARRVFDLGDDAFGRSVAAVVDAPLPDPDNPDRETVVVDTPDGRRELAVSATRVRDDRETVVGRTYLFGDVTERVTAERRLAVLGRVLRHNLRNDLDAVQAFAEALDGDEFDGEPGERGGSRAGDDPPDRAATHRRRIRDLAAGLADTGATVAEMERLFSRPSVREPAEPVAVADGVAARFDDHAGTVRVRAAGSPDELVTDPELLSTALAELVENGLEHADDPTPTVEVVVAATASGVAVAVHDEGPGIPAREREVLVAGEEPLRHGSGLGLWFVWLAVRRLGGELSFAERDGVGSVVTLTVPDRSVAE